MATVVQANLENTPAFAFVPPRTSQPAVAAVDLTALAADAIQTCQDVEALGDGHGVVDAHLVKRDDPV